MKKRPKRVVGDLIKEARRSVERSKRLRNEIIKNWAELANYAKAHDLHYRPLSKNGGIKTAQN